MPNRYRRKPVEVEAVRWDGSAETVNAFAGERYSRDWEYLDGGPAAWFMTNQGWVKARVGDWLLKGPLGEVWCCEAETFPLLYEEA